MAITPLTVSDTPNEGREKINANDAYLDEELTNKVNNDGSTPFAGNQSMGNNQLLNLVTDPDNPSGAVNVSTLRQGTGILSRLKYVSVSSSHTIEKYLYADDGTTVTGYGVSTLEDAFDKTDGTSWWVISVEADYQAGIENFNLLKNYTKLVGIGKPEILFSGDMTNYFFAENIKFNTSQENTHMARGRIDNCEVWFADDKSAAPKSLLLDDRVVIKNSLLVTNSNGAIILGAHGYFHISGNDMSVDLSGEGSNEPNAQNLISTNLKSRLEEVNPNV